ncbi:MAG: hypothetical protein AW11_00118 [Candidatus Accumulibacter regalis]|jgi:hypothetical protein|uniref:DUF547 domain-containing protein n=1 Tax=Accumulibacter regalis TaxID=522306 RepID=A0A011QPS8_ACCRE|nr:MAG: hypothetical protein AW11_00118 [Candidatus Accumulibacter regalis]MBL8369398.1 DUF547 domain-containing protein [Accumulibacter sp.]MBN8515176.1 DUF547 domain-containing protein [Accumulibacter sp.]MBO3702039.1 DUF547 domain-containing protein [Accumulibacter sp.]MQM33222.1 DUF547 domain-containing protein [Candidatus Accumulibacter phosphatis]
MKNWTSWRAGAKWTQRILALALLGLSFSATAAFDHSHAAWTALLKRHVVLIDGGKASQVDYAGLARERPALTAYLESLSAVQRAHFESWPKVRQLAFLINAYNAFTVDLILGRYPDLQSIRDLGNIVFNSPWKQKFFSLFGEPRHLDWIEHELIRKPGAYDDPRIHFAVNCASLGCPMLREEAFVGERLDEQLEQQTRRFLADRTRNRYEPRTATLMVSPIFDWYGKDFQAGYRGVTSLRQFLGNYADLLARTPAEQALLRQQLVGIDFLDYDWALNSVPR